MLIDLTFAIFKSDLFQPNKLFCIITRYANALVACGLQQVNTQTTTTRKKKSMAMMYLLDLYPESGWLSRKRQETPTHHTLVLSMHALRDLPHKGRGGGGRRRLGPISYLILFVYHIRS